MNSCQFPAMIEQLFTDFPVARILMEIIFVRRCKKSKQNSDKIIHRNTALNSTFFLYFYAIIAIEHVFPSINIRWGNVENLPRNQANVNGKTCMRAMLESLATSCHKV